MQALLVKLVADGALLLILAISAPFVLMALRKRFWANAPVLVMAGLTSLLVGKMMSLIYQPAIARPFLELGVEPGAAYIDNPGFPSDHALLATVAVVAVYALTRNRKLTIFLGLMVLVMCMGRVIALVHTPLDVIGGVLAGLSGALWYKKLTK
jgi:membrane-associated phospholipid phosphatase